MSEMSSEIRACIDEGLRCDEPCLDAAMELRRDVEGIHAGLSHRRVTLARAKACSAAVHAVLIGTASSDRICEDRADL